jgi:hypothetical protein
VAKKTSFIVSPRSPFIATAADNGNFVEHFPLLFVEMVLPGTVLLLLEFFHDLSLTVFLLEVLLFPGDQLGLVGEGSGYRRDGLIQENDPLLVEEQVLYLQAVTLPVVALKDHFLLHSLFAIKLGTDRGMGSACVNIPVVGDVFLPFAVL